jgi:trans-aconitate methyltransferase
MDIREWNIVASGDFSRRHPWETARLWSLLKLLKENGFSSERRFTLLDFGAGDLFVAAGVKSAFPSASIVSIDSAYDEKLISNLKKSGNFESVSAFRSVDAWHPQPAEQADVVLLLDVLEHCRDDVAVLKMLKQTGKISPSAVWFVTVPAYQSLYSQHDQFLGHYRRYKLQQLKASVGNAGLSVNKGGYFFASLLAPRMLSKLLESTGLVTRRPQGLAGFKWGELTGRAIALALYLDFLAGTFFGRFGLKLPGLSCYVVAK